MNNIVTHLFRTEQEAKKAKKKKPKKSEKMASVSGNEYAMNVKNVVGEGRRFVFPKHSSNAEEIGKGVTTTVVTSAEIAKRMEDNVEGETSGWMTGEDMANLLMTTLRRNKKKADAERHDMDKSESFNGRSRCIIECPTCHRNYET